MRESFERYTDERRCARRGRRKPRPEGLDGASSASCSGGDASASSPAASSDHDDVSSPRAGGADAASKTDSSTDENEDEVAGRHSMKRNFMAKVMSPVIGYGTRFDLLQYVYDLNLWSTLGSRKNLNFDTVPMRVMMKGNSFSPLYWREVHEALIDLVRHLGPPQIFWT